MCGCFGKMCNCESYIYGSVHRHSILNKIQQDATVYRYLFTVKLLYTFRVSIAPSIRSTQNRNCSLWYRSQYLSNNVPPT